MSPLVTVLTSAGVAAFVSSLLALYGQYLERKSRRDELIFAKALDMAVEHTRVLMRVAEGSGQSVPLYDNVVKAETYYQWLKHLFEKGELPPDAQKFRPTKKA